MTFHSPAVRIPSRIKPEDAKLCVKVYLKSAETSAILYSFTSTTVSDKLMKNGRSAVRFEIITEHPQDIANAIIHNFRHSATLIPGKGMYKGKEVSVLICIVNRTQVTALSSLIRSFPNTFATICPVDEVMGNFKKISIDGKIEKEYLDQADGKAV